MGAAVAAAGELDCAAAAPDPLMRLLMASRVWGCPAFSKLSTISSADRPFDLRKFTRLLMGVDLIRGSLRKRTPLAILLSFGDDAAAAAGGGEARVGAEGAGGGCCSDGAETIGCDSSMLSCVLPICLNFAQFLFAQETT